MHKDKLKTNPLHFLCLLLIPLFPLMLMGGGLFFCYHNTGFSLDKITSTLNYDEKWEMEPLTIGQREQLFTHVFSQTYYHLASGKLCYAFVSQDRQFVIKFFKMRHLSNFWLDGFAFPFTQKFGFKKKESAQFMIERIFESYKNAYQSMRKETGLLYLHFNKVRELKAKITLIDSKGKKYLVDLDKVEFVVQKQADKVIDHLNHLLREKKFEDLYDSIHSLLKLIAVRCEKGFADHHIGIRSHFGFVGNTAIQIDCATLTRDSSMKYPLNFRQELMHVAELLNVWAQAHYPEMTLFIQQEAQKIINNSAF